jgi:ubiquinone/menaquinone biosynthesis C-methylase UbiE
MEKIYDGEYGEAVRPLPKKYMEIVEKWLRVSKEDQVLEMGCNQGTILNWLKEHTRNAFGVDINEDALFKAQNKRTVIGDIAHLPFDNESFDKTISIHTLEHIPDLSSVFHEIDRVTKSGGLSLHFFPRPWTAIRGLDGALLDALKTTNNPVEAFKLARKYHVHILNPEKIEGFCSGTNLKMDESKSFLVMEEGGMSWGVLLKKE